MSRKSTFIKWIDQVGKSNLAEKLGVDPSAVTHWVKGRNRPSVEQMKKIRELSGGLIGFEEIIEGVSR